MNKNNLKVLLLLLLGSFLIPVVSYAETVIRVEDSVSVEADQKVESDFYARGNNISMSGEIAGDMYAIGGSVTVNGEVAEDLSVLSGVTQVHATVTDDVRVVSGEVVIAEGVGGDVFVIGGMLKVLSSARITGDVYFFGGEADISGEVTGSIYGTADKMRIDSVVGKDVDVAVTKGLTLGDRADIAGDVRFQSDHDLVRASDAVIGGDVLKQSVAIASVDTKEILVFFLVSLFSVLVSYLFFRTWLIRIIDVIFNRWTLGAGLGFALLVLMPVVGMLLIVSVLGSVLGLISILVWVALLMAAWVVANVMAGAVIAMMLKKQPEVGLVWVVIGTIALHSLIIIPYLGLLLIITAVVTAMGGIVLAARSAL